MRYPRGRGFPNESVRDISRDGVGSTRMKPEDRALIVIVLAVAIVVAPLTAYVLLVPQGHPTFLPIPAGTTFSLDQSANWTARITVGLAGGILIGAWTAFNGLGFVTLGVTTGSVSKSPPIALCPYVIIPWAQRNGTEDLPLSPGSYTLYWTTGSCSWARVIVVTQTIQLIPS